MNRQHRVGMILALMLFSIMLMLSVVAEECKASGDYRVGVMPTSKHINANPRANGGEGYNERHGGVILETRVLKGEQWEGWVGVMTYNNSFSERSNTIYWSTDFYESPFVSLGYQLGAVTGYKHTITPYTTLTVTLNVFGNLKPRFVVLPIVVGNQVLVEW